MVDGINTHVTLFDPIRLNNALDFSSIVNLNTAELGGYNFSVDNGLKFKFYRPTPSYPNGRLMMSGSLHKYYNGGKHNCNDFGIQQLRDVEGDLFKKYGIRFENCHLWNVEFGANIVLPHPVKKVLRHLLFQSTTPFTQVRVPGNGYCVVAAKQNYLIKCYDKGTQFSNLNYNTAPLAKLEYKTIKMAELHSLGIKTLADLAFEGLFKAKHLVIDRIDNSIFYDFSVLEGVPDFRVFRDKIFWDDLKEDHYEKFKYARKKLHSKIIANPKNLKSFIKSELKNTFVRLTQEIPDIHPLNTQLEQGIDPKLQGGRICPETRLNIEMQPSYSKYLTKTGLLWYMEKQPEIFAALKQIYLNPCWHLIGSEASIPKIARRILDTYYRRALRNAIKYPLGQPLLFNLNGLHYPIKPVIS